MPISVKTCPKCRRELAMGSFHKKARRTDGHQPLCKDCAREVLTAWRAANRARFLENAAAYRASNQEKILAAREAYKERGSEKGAAWRAANPERKKKRDASYYAANQDRIRKRTAAWVAANRDKHRENARRWKKANPACGANDRAKRRAATAAWCNKFFVREIYNLAAMRSKATGIEWHVDHIVPINSMLVCGLHVEANLQLLPAATNVRKSNMVSE